MDFKRLSQNKLFLPALAVLFVIVLLVGKSFIKTASTSQENPEAVNSSPVLLSKDTLVKPAIQKESSEKDFSKNSISDASNEDDAAIQDQLDRDRQAQKKTKYLKT